MKTIIKYLNLKKSSGQSGQVFLVGIICMMFLGCAIVVSSLVMTSTSLKNSQVYKEGVISLYAAESGIQDAIWNILNKSESDLNSFLVPHTYDEYDFGTTWSYPVSGQLNVNGKTINPEISNIWVPLVDTNNTSWIPSVGNITPPDGTITPPTLTQSNDNLSNNNYVITGGVNNVPVYNVNINYIGTGTANLPIYSVGVWLPQGFTYINGSSNLEDAAHNKLYATEQVIECAGNEAVVWTFSSKTFNGLQTSMGQLGSAILNIQIQYNTTIDRLPQCLAWMTNASTADTANFAYTWNADVKVHNLASSAGDTDIEAFAPKSETRTLGSAVSGDYIAIGNSLMTGSDPYYLDTPLANSSYTVSVIPSDAELQGAFLYWTGWINGTTSTKPLNATRGTVLNFKINGNQVSFTAGGLPQLTGTISSSRNQTNSAAGDGYSYSCYKDVTELVRWELERENPTATNITGNAIYDVGPATGCILTEGGHEKSHAGWSLVLVYSSAATLGHQLYLYDTFTFNPWTNSGGDWGATSTHGGDIDPTNETDGPGGVISGFLVPAPVPGDTIAAKLTCFVGEGDIGYSGDFLAVNAPEAYWANPWSIPDGNSSKLWDNVTIGNYPNGSGQNLPNTAAQPDNVWNSKSQSGATTIDGVDIKTFYITWASNLIQQGDTSARIDMPTWQDSWNLVYMIISFRSEVISGGSVSYLIRRKD
jgi:hypothetical protein